MCRDSELRHLACSVSSRLRALGCVRGGFKVVHGVHTLRERGASSEAVAWQAYTSLPVCCLLSRCYRLHGAKLLLRGGASRGEGSKDKTRGDVGGGREGGRATDVRKRRSPVLPHGSGTTRWHFSLFRLLGLSEAVKGAQSNSTARTTWTRQGRTTGRPAPSTSAHPPRRPATRARVLSFHNPSPLHKRVDLLSACPPSCSWTSTARRCSSGGSGCTCRRSGSRACSA